MTILDEFKKHDMAGIIVSHKTFQDIRIQHPVEFVEMSDGNAYLYGLLLIKHPLCPDNKAYVINQDLVNNFLWHQSIMRGILDE